jgi:hypothetical protein
MQSFDYIVLFLPSRRILLLVIVEQRQKVIGRCQNLKFVSRSFVRRYPLNRCGHGSAKLVSATVVLYSLAVPILTVVVEVVVAKEVVVVVEVVVDGWTDGNGRTDGWKDGEVTE